MDSNEIIHVAINVYGAIAVTLLFLLFFGLISLSKFLDKKRKMENAKNQRLVMGMVRPFITECPSMILRKFEEGPKMSKVKIAYKSVDKKAKIIEAIKRTTFLPPMRVVAETLADEIIAIDNAKENDGEIFDITIDKDGRHTLKIGTISPDLSSTMPIMITMPNIKCLLLTSQETYELGQALIKMSGCNNRECKNCSVLVNIPRRERPCLDCHDYDKWEPVN